LPAYGHFAARICAPILAVGFGRVKVLRRAPEFFLNYPLSAGSCKKILFFLKKGIAFFLKRLLIIPKVH
jgi:hypothetical protein